jgi:hypothetical protein
MAELSQDDRAILLADPLNSTLDHLRDALHESEQAYSASSSLDDETAGSDRRLQDSTLDLPGALADLRAAGYQLKSSFSEQLLNLPIFNYSVVNTSRIASSNTLMMVSYICSGRACGVPILILHP